MIVDPLEAARLLADDQAVAYPTETVYGLGVNASSPSALRSLRALKGSPRSRGFSVLVPDVDALARWVPELSETARDLARRFWPGPVTLVLETDHVALSEVATSLGVGFRCSPQATAAALARGAPGPVVSTSCNRSGEPPCASAQEVERIFGSELPIAGGEPAGGLSASTVVAVGADGKLELVRQGALPFAELCEVVRR